jgi:hypothetical protein
MSTLTATDQARAAAAYLDHHDLTAREIRTSATEARIVLDGNTTLTQLLDLFHTIYLSRLNAFLVLLSDDPTKYVTIELRGQLNGLAMELHLSVSSAGPVPTKLLTDVPGLIDAKPHARVPLDLGIARRIAEADFYDESDSGR